MYPDTIENDDLEREISPEFFRVFIEQEKHERASTETQEARQRLHHALLLRDKWYIDTIYLTEKINENFKKIFFNFQRKKIKYHLSNSSINLTN